MLVTKDAPCDSCHFGIPKRNYLEVFFSYLLFRFKIALWRHQVIFVHLIITKKDAPWSKNSKNVKILRFEPRNPKLWQFEDLKLLSSATKWYFSIGLQLKGCLVLYWIYRRKDHEIWMSESKVMAIWKFKIAL